MLQEYWLPFAKLDEKAREEWLCGALFPSLLDIPEGLRRHKAAVACTTAVEIELRERVFRKYREYLLERPSLKQNANNGLRDQRSLRFCQFLVADGHLTLGDMATVLRKFIRSDQPVFRDFTMWLNRSHLRLIRDIDNLGPVTAFRNPAIHENRTEAVPETVIKCCRSILEALTAGER